MNQLQLMLVPAPGQAAQALATLTVVDPSPAVSKVWQQVTAAVGASTGASSTTIVLEGYTRDSWAWKGAAGNVWTTCTVVSVDGKHKLPGFVKYLKERQKCAYGRFLVTKNQSTTTALWVVSYVQGKNSNDDRMDCRIALDVTQVPGCVLSAQPPPKKVAPVTAAAVPRKATGGLLGKLLGAQKKTNQHVLTALAPAKSSSAAAANGSTTAGGAAATTPAVTATQVLADFRSDMEQQMLDFDISAASELKVALSLAKYQAGLTNTDKARVTMEILKYMVYEAAEEVNEAWIALKEASDFVDEVTIGVYKEGAAPPEVLEEYNQGELPEEMRAQQRALQGERLKQQSAAEHKRNKGLETAAHQQAYEDDEEGGDQGGGLAALNQTKRDRRTIEDYERAKKKTKP